MPARMTTTQRFDEILNRQRVNLARTAIVGAFIVVQVLWSAATIF